MDIINLDIFLKADIRIGTIIRSELFSEARKPAIKLWIDFGPDIGIKKSSAQITENYSAENLLLRQVSAVINFPPRQIGSFMSEVLVLGALGAKGIVLLVPDKDVEEGENVH